MNNQTIKNALESILFVAGDAVRISDAANALGVDPASLSGMIDDLMREKEKSGAGVLLVKVDDKVQLCSNPEYKESIEKALQPITKSRLSQSLLETLSIIAYRQPITRFEIEQIRGVQCNYSIAMLIEKGLIQRAGRKKTLGNPLLYETSEEFLRHFGISAISELPELKEAE